MFKNSQEVEQEVIEDSIRIKELPSKFLPYPEDLEIRYNTYKYGDVKKASQNTFTEKDTVEFVLKGIFVKSEVEPDFVVTDLTLADFLYIGLYRKMSSFGVKEFQISSACEKCKGVITKKISWDTLDFDELEIPKLPVVVKLFDKSIIKFNPLTIAGYLKLLDEESSGDDIKAIFETVSNKKEISYDAFYNLSIEDGKLIDKVDSLLYHGLKTMKFTCKCKHVNWVSVDGKEALIRPFRESEEIAENRICYGV